MTRVRKRRRKIEKEREKEEQRMRKNEREEGSVLGDHPSAAITTFDLMNLICDEPSFLFLSLSFTPECV